MKGTVLPVPLFRARENLCDQRSLYQSPYCSCMQWQLKQINLKENLSHTTVCRAGIAFCMAMLNETYFILV